MINLKDSQEEINKFILSGLEKFRNQYGEPNSIGIYCSPTNGWISINFNKEKSLVSTNNNCPDFEFVEYDSLKSENWREEYESNNPAWINPEGDTLEFTDNSTDEELNKFYFNYLDTLISELKKANQTPEILLQMLDSNCVKLFS